jgi:hypothetical protein
MYSRNTKTTNEPTASNKKFIYSVQRPVSSASITGLYMISEAAFKIALLGVLLYNIEIIFQNLTLGYMTKTLNQIFFPSTKSEFLLQQHWESKYFSNYSRG